MAPRPPGRLRGGYRGRVGEWIIRPMRPDDVADAERLTAHSFLAVDRREVARSAPEPHLRPATRAEHWVHRTFSFLQTDPGGCWVAEDETGLLGIATSTTRELLWTLASFAVRPDQQGRGIGTQLLAAALHHGRGCLRGMLSASADPRAVRRYRLAGFSLHPQMVATGVLDRTAIPVIEKVREAGRSDRDLMDSVDRRTRGAAHGSDHDLLARQGRPLVCDTTTGSGYVYADRGRVAALAATDRRTASMLLWAALAEAPDEPVSLAHVTAANEWAVDVALAARLEVRTEGYLCVRSMKPPAPYIHNGALL
jgi:GNAT superfamily N-acetyltransferase